MAVIETSHGGELTNEGYGQFFAPVSSDAVDALVATYQQARGSIGEIAAYVRENMQGTFGYFVSGNVPADRRPSVVPTSQSRGICESVRLMRLYGAIEIGLGDFGCNLGFHV